MIIINDEYFKSVVSTNACTEAEIADCYFHFQPIYCLKTDKIKLYEALLRSDSFDNVEEAVAAIMAQGKEDLLTLHTLNAIKPYFNKAEQENINFSLNFEPTQIASAKFPALVKYFFNRFNIPKQNIILEITERSCELPMYQKMIENAKELIADGFHFAIDDFGTGMSNFELLSQLKIKLIKIDGCFSNSAFENQHSRGILEIAATFKEKFNCAVCIEGLETQDHIDFVKNLDFCFGQGYGLAMPGPLNFAVAS